MIHDFLQANFGITGGLYSNLIASAILGFGGYLYGRASERRSIRRHDELKDHIIKVHKHLGIK